MKKIHFKSSLLLFVLAALFSAKTVFAQPPAWDCANSCKPSCLKGTLPQWASTEQEQCYIDCVNSCFATK